MNSPRVSKEPCLHRPPPAERTDGTPALPPLTFLAMMRPEGLCWTLVTTPPFPAPSSEILSKSSSLSSPTLAFWVRKASSRFFCCSSSSSSSSFFWRSTRFALQRPRGQASACELPKRHGPSRGSCVAAVRPAQVCSGGRTGESGPIPESCRHTAAQTRRPASGGPRPPPPLFTETRGPRDLEDQLLVSDPGALLPDPRLQTTLGTRQGKAQARTPVFARMEEQTRLERPQSKDQWGARQKP